MNDTVVVSIGPTASVAAGTGDVWYWKSRLGAKYKIKAADLMPHNAQTANATNYSTYTLAKNGTAIAAFALDTPTTDDQTAGVAYSLLSLIVGTELEVADGDVLSWTKAETASGLAGHNTCDLVLEKVRA